MTLPDPEALRGVQSADVYKAGRLAASLTRSDAGVVFAYRDEYLAEPGEPIARTLPRSAGPSVTAAGAVPAFFAGLLPEGRRLAHLRRTVKTSADDELSLLLAVGRDPVGDVQVVPAGAPLTPAEPLVQIRAGAELRFSELLDQAGIIDPVALAGVQDKVSAAVLSLPVGREGTRFILKLDPPEFPELVANEAYFIELATRVGLPAVTAERIYDEEGRSGLLVTRFDRPTGGIPRALACEDVCQLLGRWPADKYNLTAERAVAALADVCTARPVAIRDAFRQLTFAWLTGNGDVHAKNLSALRQPDGEWRVAPAYDLPATVPYGDTSLALSMNGRTTGLSRRHLLAFAANIGLAERAAVGVIDQLLDATAGLIDALQAGAVPFEQRTRTKWCAQLKHRRQLLG